MSVTIPQWPRRAGGRQTARPKLEALMVPGSHVFVMEPADVIVRGMLYRPRVRRGKNRSETGVSPSCV